MVPCLTMSKLMDKSDKTTPSRTLIGNADAIVKKKQEKKDHASNHVTFFDNKNETTMLYMNSHAQDVKSHTNIRDSHSHEKDSENQKEFQPTISDSEVVNEKLSESSQDASDSLNDSSGLSPKIDRKAVNNYASNSVQTDGASHEEREMDTESKKSRFEDPQLEDIKVHRLSGKPHTAWDTMKKDIQVETVKALPYDTVKPNNCLRFVCLSDTHSRVEQRDFAKTVPEGDVLLHAGDFTIHGQVEECIAFNAFLGELPHPVKLVIPGNHETLLDPELPAVCQFTLRKQLKLSLNPKQYNDKAEGECVRKLISNALILIDELTEICGIKIYGTPWVPSHGYPAFGCSRGRMLLSKYKNIPNDIDILMSHGPPLGFGDRTSSGRHVGCVDLLNCIRQRIKPKYVISGHIHEGYGICSDGTTTYINAAICTKGYKPIQKPIIFDYPLPEPYTREDFMKYLQRNGPSSETVII